jgi:glyoxylase-like metal-dependent hydrolase (beta-lactamase superfamily II)
MKFAIGAVLALGLAGAALAQGGAGPAAQPYKPPKSIDYSSKHAIMIRSDDGALTRMDVPYYRSKLIAPGTWQIESDGDYSYLIEGDDEALAIDTGYGAGNIRDYLQTLTKKPVRYVANTHDHFDHTALNGLFDAAYMSAETAKKATIPYRSFAGVTFPQDYPRRIVSDGYVFHLGNRDVEVFLIPNHTAGGTAYLDKRERILFSGDEFFGNNQPIGVSVAQYAANMRKLEARRRDFDRMAGGPGLFDATLVDKDLAAAELVLSGKEGDVPASPPGGPAAAPAPADPNAPVVYLRRRVRAPDRPASMTAGPNPNARTMTYQDVRITYDVRKIQN